jgi:hypothetical protein
MRKVWAAVLGSSLVAACGGGGGDGGSSGFTAITINSTNQDAVAKAAVSATASLAGAGGGVTADSSSTASAGGKAALSIASRQLATRLGLAGTRKHGAAVRPAAVVSSTESCSLGGTVTTSLGDSNNDGSADLGETLTLSFTNCAEDASGSLNGSMAITLQSASSNSFSAAVTMTQLSVTDGTFSASLGGSMTMSFIVDSSTQIRLVLQVADAGVTAVVAAGGTSETIDYGAGFLFSETIVLDGADALVSASSISGGVFRSSALGGRVTLEQPQAALQLASENYPHSGMLRVVGNASALRLTVLSATTVRVELDANLDGSYEASKDVAWSTLLPL